MLEQRGAHASEDIMKIRGTSQNRFISFHFKKDKVQMYIAICKRHSHGYL